jgi:hypothetical protein
MMWPEIAGTCGSNSDYLQSGKTNRAGSWKNCVGTAYGSPISTIKQAATNHLHSCDSIHGFEGGDGYQGVRRER